MSDTAAYYMKLRKRAEKLRERLDESIKHLMFADSDVNDLAKADLGEPGELSVMDQAYLERCVADALFYTRMAEEINNGYIADLDRQLPKLGIDPLAITAPRNDDDGHV